MTGDAGPAERRRSDVLALLGLLSLVLLLFRRAVFLGEAIYERDIGYWYYPQVESILRVVASGAWPLWDPYMGFGVPLLANPSSQILYPLTPLHLLLEPWTFYTLYVVGHLVFAGAGQYLLARRLGLSALAAWLAACAWTASGPLLSLVNMWHHFSGATWIPWILLGAERARASLRTRDALLWGAAISGQILAGSAEMCAMAAFATLPVLVRPGRGESPEGRASLRWWRAVALAWGFAGAFTAAQWLPALELIRGTQRTGLAEVVRTDWSVHPLALLQTVLPVFTWGVPFATPDERLNQEAARPLLYSLYLGAGVLGLAVSGLLGPRRPSRLHFALLFVGALLVALGRHAPFYGALVALVPPLTIVRFPVKALVLASCACSMLAGMGLDAWRGVSPSERPPRAFPWFSALLAVCALAGGGLLAASDGRLALPIHGQEELAELLAATASRVGLAGLAALLAGLLLRRASGGRRLAHAAAAVAIGELTLAHLSVNPTAPRRLLAERPATVSAIAADGAAPPTRLYTFDYFTPSVGKQHPSPYVRAALDLTDERGPRGLQRALGMRMLFPASGRWGLASSFDRDNLGLSPPHKRALIATLRAAEETPHYARLLAISGVQYVLALHREGLEGLSELAAVPSPFALPILVFRVPEPLPFAYAVGRGRVLDARTLVFDALVDRFDPRQEVLLTEGPALVSPDGPKGTLRVRERRGDRVVIESDLDKPGYVVLTDAYDEGWRATVDGRPAPLLRANIAFRAVVVPAGRHVVEQVYRPRAVLLGLWLSLLGLVAGLGLAWLGPQSL